MVEVADSKLAAVDTNLVHMQVRRAQTQALTLSLLGLSNLVDMAAE